MKPIAPSSRAFVAAKLRLESSTKASAASLLDEFKRFGFIEGGSYTTSIADFDDREPQARLIRCLWADLKAFGALRDSSEEGLADFIRRATKVDSIRWLTAPQANVVIESLKQWQRRIRYGQHSTGH